MDFGDYYEFRSQVARSVPRLRPIFRDRQVVDAVREKGRKKGYAEYKLDVGKMVPQERLLNTQEVNSFLEVSCRAAACPMPLNMDVWDGLLCPFGCKYCYANAFRASLYTAFFDNAKTMGTRHCNPDKYKQEMDVLMGKARGKDPHSINNPIAKAIAMGIPVRFGIRFEDFLKEEAQAGVSYQMLRYLQQEAYPLMINTKSDLVGQDKYVRVLAENPAGAAVHITLISSNNKLLKQIEPGAPSYSQRIKAMKALSTAGVRVVARIEPFLPFVCDEPEEVERYITDVKNAGVKNITFDTWSYTAKNPGIAQSFKNLGIDWERIFLAGCDSQGLGSLLLGKFMDIFRRAGFSCSTFDMGNVPSNDQAVCCEVSDWWPSSGWNYGSTVFASRYIRDHPGDVISWKDYEHWVNEKGGFLSPALQKEVRLRWNGLGNAAYSHSWSQGIIPVGQDETGILWTYMDNDFRTQAIGVIDGQ